MKSLKTTVFIFLAIFCGITTGTAQTSLVFDEISDMFMRSYEFTSGDKIYFSAGKKTNDQGTCPGSNSDGAARTYRIQEENPFILHLTSTSASSLMIYGISKINTTMTIHKIEVAESLNGVYKDITRAVTIENNMVGNKKCGKLSFRGAAIPKDSFVRLTITDKNGISRGLNISEIYVKN